MIPRGRTCPQPAPPQDCAFRTDYQASRHPRHWPHLAQYLEPATCSSALMPWSPPVAVSRGPSARGPGSAGSASATSDTRPRPCSWNKASTRRHQGTTRTRPHRRHSRVYAHVRLRLQRQAIDISWASSDQPTTPTTTHASQPSTSGIAVTVAVKQPKCPAGINPAGHFVDGMRGFSRPPMRSRGRSRHQFPHPDKERHTFPFRAHRNITKQELLVRLISIRQEGDVPHLLSVVSHQPVPRNVTFGAWTFGLAFRPNRINLKSANNGIECVTSRFFEVGAQRQSRGRN